MITNTNSYSNSTTSKKKSKINWIAIAIPIILSALFSVSTGSAQSVSKKYTYTRTNAVIDDSWIGTLQSASSETNEKKITLVGDTQVSDGSWILPTKTTEVIKKESQSIHQSGSTSTLPKKKVKHIVLDSAPENNIPDATLATNNYIPAVYTTPNGTLLTNITSTYIAPVTNVESILTFNNGLSRS